MKHFGNEFQRVVEESGLQVTEIATRLSMTRRNMYRIFEKESVDLALAIKISEALQHDFLQNYLLPENYRLLKEAQREIRQNLYTSRQN